MTDPTYCETISPLGFVVAVVPSDHALEVGFRPAVVEDVFPTYGAALDHARRCLAELPLYGERAEGTKVYVVPLYLPTEEVTP